MKQVSQPKGSRHKWMACGIVVLFVLHFAGDIRNVRYSAKVVQGQQQPIAAQQQQDPWQELNEGLPSTVSNYATTDGLSTQSMSQSCLRLNSQEWLLGPRFQNAVKNRANEDDSLFRWLDALEGSIDGAAADDAGDTSSHADMPQQQHQMQFMDVFSSTVCSPTSRIRSSWLGDDGSIGEQDNTSDSSNERVLWKIRMIYIAIHYHQHRHAMPEGKLRRAASATDAAGSQADDATAGQCDEERKRFHVGAFDYECPNAKLLIAEMPPVAGLGSVSRVDATNFLMVGLATNRTVLFVNNVKFNGSDFASEAVANADADMDGGQNQDGGDSSARTTPADNYPRAIKYERFGLASCPRNDTQCTFQSMSPCVPTYREMAEAPIVRTPSLASFLSKDEGALFRSRRVVRLKLRRSPLSLGHDVAEFLRATAHEWIDGHFPPNENDDNANTDSSRRSLRSTLIKAADAIAGDVPETDGDEYRGSESSVKQASMMYILRPRLDLQPMLRKTLNDNLASSGEESSAPTLRLGLPIRSSDKCREVSECLIFPNYMKALAELWTQQEQPQESQQRQLQQGLQDGDAGVTMHKNATPRVDIILTSESDLIFGDKDKYLHANKHALPFQPNFILNHADIHQGTGGIDETRPNYLFDKVLFSALTTLQLQLEADLSLGNCCSNFHNVLFDLLRAGCGQRQQRGQCLQKHPNPEFRLCCFKAPQCMRERDRDLAKHLNVSKVRLMELQKW